MDRLVTVKMKSNMSEMLRLLFVSTLILSSLTKPKPGDVNIFLNHVDNGQYILESGKEDSDRKKAVKRIKEGSMRNRFLSSSM